MEVGIDALGRSLHEMAAVIDDIDEGHVGDRRYAEVGHVGRRHVGVEARAEPGTRCSEEGEPFPARLGFDPGRPLESQECFTLLVAPAPVGDVRRHAHEMAGSASLEHLPPDFHPPDLTVGPAHHAELLAIVAALLQGPRHTLADVDSVFGVNERQELLDGPAERIHVNAEDRTGGPVQVEGTRHDVPRPGAQAAGGERQVEPQRTGSQFGLGPAALEHETGRGRHCLHELHLVVGEGIVLPPEDHEHPPRQVTPADRRSHRHAKREVEIRGTGHEPGIVDQTVGHHHLLQRCGVARKRTLASRDPHVDHDVGRNHVASVQGRPPDQFLTIGAGFEQADVTASDGATDHPHGLVQQRVLIAGLEPELGQPRERGLLAGHQAPLPLASVDGHGGLDGRLGDRRIDEDRRRWK
jgi:hypothetical protein